jgi:hypothetical protein
MLAEVLHHGSYHGHADLDAGAIPKCHLLPVAMRCAIEPMASVHLHRTAADVHDLVARLCPISACAWRLGPLPPRCELAQTSSLLKMCPHQLEMHPDVMVVGIPSPATLHLRHDEP